MTKITETKLVTCSPSNTGLLSKTDKRDKNNKFGLNPLVTILNKDFNPQLRRDYTKQLKTREKIIDIDYIVKNQHDIRRLFKEYYKNDYIEELEKQLDISFMMKGLNSLTRSIPISLDDIKDYKRRGGYKNYVFSCEARKDIIIFDFDISVTSEQIEAIQEAFKDYLYLLEFNKSNKHLHMYLRGIGDKTLDITSTTDRKNALFTKKGDIVAIDVFKGAKRVVACSTNNNDYDIIYDAIPSSQTNVKTAVKLLANTLQYDVNIDFLDAEIVKQNEYKEVEIITANNTTSIVTKKIERDITTIETTTEEKNKLIKYITIIMNEIAGKGIRNKAYMALCGALLKFKYSENVISEIVHDVMLNSNDTDNRITIVNDAIKKYKNNQYLLSLKSLNSIVLSSTENKHTISIMNKLDRTIRKHCIDTENCFQMCIYDDDDTIAFLFSNVLQTRSICRDLLIESVKLYCTPFKDEYYVKTEKGYKYIGIDWEEYLEGLYSEIEEKIRNTIPFNTLVKRIREGRIYEKLKPHRRYILFNDCLLDTEEGDTLDIELTEDTIPYAIINENYKDIDTVANKYVLNMFKKITDDDNILISLLCSLFNKKLLGKGAIFNIQKSGTGKTLLLKPLVELGLCANVNHSMLEGNERIGLFKQYYSIIFEEIQDTVINGSSFNALIDNTDMQVQRKYKNSVTVKREHKPVVFINGESLADFRGRTKGTLNRFRFMPQFKESLSKEDYEFIENNLKEVGIEIIRHLMNYIRYVGQETIAENIKRAMKKEKEIFDLKENKNNIIFKYIKQMPDITTKPRYLISKIILIEMIKELQERSIITVDLFNSDSSIRSYINDTLIKALELDYSIVPDDLRKKRIKYKGEWKSARLFTCLQLTEKGQTLITEMGYKLSSLEDK